MTEPRKIIKDSERDESGYCPACGCINLHERDCPLVAGITTAAALPKQP